MSTQKLVKKGLRCTKYIVFGVKKKMQKIMKKAFGLELQLMCLSLILICYINID